MLFLTLINDLTYVFYDTLMAKRDNHNKYLYYKKVDRNKFVKKNMMI